MRMLSLVVGILMAVCPGSPAREALVARVEGAISPATAPFMVAAIEKAEAQDAECLIFELDTPGGLDDSMRQIIKRIMIAKVPVVVYVAPAGSRAASAGAFITLSAHVAAMAPGTTIGAAHPVNLGQSGGDTDSNMTAKVTNDSAAYIRSIAEKRGRNIAWAESAVKQSVSLSETEALKEKVIDLIAPSVPALLEALDGRVVTVGEKSVTLHTKGIATTPLAMNMLEQFLATLANPNLAYLLFMLGLMGLYFELSTPGAVLPGVVGAISLILAMFAFQTLSVNYAGVALIVLAVLLFILDIKAATHGVLTVGGLVALVIGSLMLFNSPDPALRASLRVIVPVVTVTGAFFALGVVLSIKAMIRRPVSGASSLVGADGTARSAIDAQGGTVFVSGAHWNAVSDAAIADGSRIQVVAVNGMVLKVKPVV